MKSFFWLLFFLWKGGKIQLLVCPYLRSLTTFANTREIEMCWLWYIFTPLPKPKWALRQVKIITTGIWYDYWPGLHLLSFPQYWSPVQSSSHVSSGWQVFLSSFCRSWHLPLSDIQSFVDSQYTEIIIDYLQILCKHTFFKFLYCLGLRLEAKNLYTLFNFTKFNSTLNFNLSYNLNFIISSDPATQSATRKLWNFKLIG